MGVYRSNPTRIRRQKQLRQEEAAWAARSGEVKVVRSGAAAPAGVPNHPAGAAAPSAGPPASSDAQARGAGEGGR